MSRRGSSGRSGSGGRSRSPSPQRSVSRPQQRPASPSRVQQRPSSPSRPQQRPSSPSRVQTRPASPQRPTQLPSGQRPTQLPSGGQRPTQLPSGGQRPISGGDRNVTKNYYGGGYGGYGFAPYGLGLTSGLLLGGALSNQGTNTTVVYPEQPYYEEQVQTPYPTYPYSANPQYGQPIQNIQVDQFGNPIYYY